MIFVNRRLLRSLVAVALAASIIAVAAPSAGLAARPNAYPVTNVNLRAGPGTDYPVIVTVPRTSAHQHSGMSCGLCLV